MKWWRNSPPSAAAYIFSITAERLQVLRLSEIFLIVVGKNNNVHVRFLQAVTVNEKADTLRGCTVF